MHICLRLGIATDKWSKHDLRVRASPRVPRANYILALWRAKASSATIDWYIGFLVIIIIIIIIITY